MTDELPQTPKPVEPAPEPATPPAPLAAAVAPPLPSKRMAAIVAALSVIASRRLGLDPETTEILLTLAEALLFGGAVAHVALKPRSNA